ncbi:MAG: PEP/pyruvate-binding domain-containing protein [Chitinispirillaceae bacterium]
MNKVHKLLSTGINGLDTVLKGIRPGDNIVWQVESIQDYVPFVEPFCRRANAENRRLIYFRFADHQFLLPEDTPAEVFQLHPEEGFEPFIDEIFEVIERFGRGACYVFDSLSELAVDWYSDRMLGNFFMLTCPYLYDFDTATYFALLKDRHTGLAIDAIHRTAQVVIDVYNNRNKLYVHPLKVYKRHSDNMYMLHSWNENDDFTPVRQSPVISEVLSSVPQPWLDFSSHRFDYWTRTFSKAQETAERNEESQKTEQIVKKLLRMAVTRDSRMMKLAEEYFTVDDLVRIGKRMIGTGLIGGKTVGMLLARSILLKNDTHWQERLGAHDSFYIGSDVFYTYLIRNGCWWMRRKLKSSKEEMFDSALDAQQRLLNGTFPEDIKAQFMEMLNYFGQYPIIVRSSSLLEDAYGNAFSGKYDSVFCANQGTPEERLESFMDAVRKVYASTMSPEALSYRGHWNLLDKDEQMALLVQRVSGSFYNDLFFPQAAGVGFSFNPYVWNDSIDPRSGMLRLVFGLGTRAVDRHDDDYTRVVSLSDPLARPETAHTDMRRYSQHKVDVLDLKANGLESILLEDVAQRAHDLDLKLFTTNDEEMEQRAKDHGMKNTFTEVLTFQELLSHTTFVSDMKRILKTLHEAYDYPVDIEFTANFINGKDLRINIVQCRPFQVRKGKGMLPKAESVPQERVFLSSTGPIIGNSLYSSIDRIIYITPSAYSSLSDSERYSVARLVGKLTHLKKDKKPASIMLVGPGRWGTTTPSLGVPVSFTEINSVSIICEIAYMHEGLIPDISLGTHFFNDLVEMDMLYMAVYPERKEHRTDKVFFENSSNMLAKLIPEASSWSNVVKVLESPKKEAQLFVHLDSVKQKGVCYRADPEENFTQRR